MTPAVSVVIPTRNRAAALAECLASLEAQTCDAFDVWVMDQSDDDASQDAVMRCGDPRFHYHRMPRNGACPARNLGVALSDGEIVAFLDDDCCPQPDWVARIITAFAEDPELQFIFGQLKAPPHDYVLGSYPEYLPSAEWQRGRSQRQIALVAAGANMSARRSFLYRIGGFDELLGPSRPDVKGNDSSMDYKVLRSGEKWIAAAEIEVIHTNGFRPYDRLGELYNGYAYGVGANFGRFLRRGDWYAAVCWWLEEWSLARAALGAILRLRRPRGVRAMFTTARGFVAGLRLPRGVGDVTGEDLRRMAQTGELSGPGSATTVIA